MLYGVAVPLASPFISTAGIVPAFGSTNVVAPGEWITIYGINLATESQSWTGTFPTALGGTTVTIDGKLAYLSYVSPNQINAQVPDDSTRATVPVVIANAYGSATASVKLADLSPSLYPRRSRE